MTVVDKNLVWEKRQKGRLEMAPINYLTWLISLIALQATAMQNYLVV